MINPFGLVPRTRHETVPLVLVPGLGVSGRYWVRLGRRLADGFEVLAPDLPGFGGSPRDKRLPWPSGPGVRQQADHLKAWLDARRLDRLYLCGHSTGCQVVADFAARFPERVERLILIAPTVQPGHRTLWSYATRLLAGAFFEAPSLIPVMANEYLTTGPARLLQQGARMITDAIEDRLPRLTMPTLVIRGVDDPLAPQSWAENVARGLPDGRLVTIDKVGHAVHYSAPAVTAEVVTKFLRGGLDAARPPMASAVAAPVDDPRRDKLGPIQPIPPALHATADYLVAGATLLLPKVIRCGPRTRRLLAATAVLGTVANLLSDHRLAVRRKVPMLTHAQTDLASGLHLLTATATYLRRERRLGRCLVAALGVYQIASALLTAKPTGPAELRKLR